MIQWNQMQKWNFNYGQRTQASSQKMAVHKHKKPRTKQFYKCDKQIQEL